MSPNASNSRKRNGSKETKVTYLNSVTSMTIEGERITTETTTTGEERTTTVIVTIATTLQIMTGGEKTAGT